ncbi:iron ABC transporter permease [Roseomonas sp. JC162]|uniref:Iron ABC transporter permease n=1 Tax=Neoroseomonas marina TaxID=1232220 RepID=A0A848E7H5_9PROT|nr:iron ABC transporter permease [Neoroseomonas marina]NMJ40122.1 iron ABC transporter permease [Neoroseomonas marina]
MKSASSLLIWSAAALGILVLPWHMQQDGLTLTGLVGLGQEDAEAASALWQAVAHKRFWFWPVIAALAVTLPGALPSGSARARSGFLVWGGLLGLAAIVAQGLAIGVQGWSYPWLTQMFGELDDRQFGMGLGGAVAFFAFVLLLTDGLALRGYFRGDRFVSGAVGVLVASILLFTAWPVLTVLSQMFTPRGELGVAAAFADRLVDRKIWGLACVTGNVNCGVFWNTLLLATSTATAATMLGLCFALIVTRTGFPMRRGLRLLTVLPIITPPFVIGLGLILIFGRSGVVNQIAEAVFGLQLGRWIYGFAGVFLAQVFSFTPTAFLVLIGVVEGISPTMEEASQTLRASRMRTFSAVTLPLMLPGLANAWLVVFVESLADFGNPIVLGGSFGVLSTEIFFAVVGAQQDFGRAAVLAAVMLVVALVAFIIQRAVVGTRSYVSLTGKGDVGLPTPLPRRIRILAFSIAIPWAVLTIVVYAMAMAGAFVRVWGRDWTPTLSHFQRAFALEWGPTGGLIFSGGAWHSLFTTIQLAAIAAPVTAGIGLLAAWVLTRQRFAGRTALEFALMLTFAVPGTVIGVAYILTFNIPPLEITGTAMILVICFVFRNLPVGVRSGVAAMSQLDKSLDEAAVTLRASTFRAIRTVVLPLLKPAIVTALVYSFVRAMTTVSAVIFLVSAQYEMATVFIINRVINGDYGLAIAYCAVLIVLMMSVIGLINLLVGSRRLGRRQAAPPALPAGGRA